MVGMAVVADLAGANPSAMAETVTTMAGVIDRDPDLPVVTWTATKAADMVTALTTAAATAITAATTTTVATLETVVATPTTATAAIGVAAAAMAVATSSSTEAADPTTAS